MRGKIKRKHLQKNRAGVALAERLFSFLSRPCKELEKTETKSAGMVLRRVGVHKVQCDS